MIARQAEKDALDAAYFFSTNYSRKLQAIFSEVTPRPISQNMSKGFYSYYTLLIDALVNYNPNRNFFSRHNGSGFEVRFLGSNNPLSQEQFLQFLRASNANVQIIIQEFQKHYPDLLDFFQDLSVQSALIVANYQKALQKLSEAEK